MGQGKFIKNLIYIIIIVILLIILYKVYTSNNFNEYIRAEFNAGVSHFSRDSEVKYSNMNSYRIDNPEFNDAMFFKTIKVVPNTSYKVTCMVKTDSVVNKTENTDAGAHICINDSTEKSDNVTGTSDWTKLEFVFNSKNREEVSIGFRLGGNFDNSTGTAWFSDISIEVGASNEDKNWKFLCLLFKETDVTLTENNKHYNFKLSYEDIEDMKACMNRFKYSMKELSNNKMNVSYDIKEVDIPISSMSHDDENGYFVAPYDVREVLDEYIKQGKYDHIFIAFRTGGTNQEEQIPVNSWIGLGSMEYRNIGFSNIRLPNSASNYIYKYDESVNVFPEEVFVHEFLHTLERNAEEYGYERPELHNNERYGYSDMKLTGLKQWYADYMNKKIKISQGEYIGLPEEIFTKKPSKTSDFEYSRQLDYFKEPSNIFEELNSIKHKLQNMFVVLKTNKNGVVNNES